MVILELAFQGVRGFSPSGRIALKPGYLLLTPPSSAHVPLAGLVGALLFADGRGGDAAFLAPGQKTGRVGLTVLGNDQQTYRLLRDLGGSGALHRFDKASQKFQLVTEDASEAAQFLRSQVGLPTRGAFEQLFLFSASQLPTRASRPKPTAGRGTSGSGAKPMLASAMSVEATSDVDGARAKLAELEKELVLSKEVGRIQFRVDELASDGFELEQQLKMGERLRAQVREAQEAYDRAPTPESLELPKDIFSKLERYPQLIARRDEALQKLSSEREGVRDESALPPPNPVWRDSRFLGGIGFGTAALVAGAFLSGWAKYVALLDIPAFGLSALLAMKYLDELQGSRAVSSKGGRLELREKKIRDQFESEAQDVKRAMHTLDVETPEEVLQVLARKPLLGEKLQELRAQLESLEMDPAHAAAAAQYQQLKAEQEALNAELLEKGGGYFRDEREVERELARVQESISLAERGSPRAEPSFSAVAAESGEQLDDPGPRLLSTAADLLATDIATLFAQASPRCAQYLAALTDRRYHGVEVDRDGHLFLLAPGRRVPAGELPGRELDLVYLALRLTLVEKVCGQAKLPLIIEDPPPVDDAKHPLLARMLKHLGTVTQVLHATGAPSFATAADAAVKC